MARKPKPSGRTKRFRGSMTELVARLEAAGYTVERTRNGHYRVLTDEGYVIMPQTPSDPRAIPNAVSVLRRKGVDI